MKNPIELLVDWIAIKIYPDIAASEAEAIAERIRIEISREIIKKYSRGSIFLRRGHYTVGNK